MRDARALSTHIFVTHLLVDLRRKFVIVTEIGDDKLMTICSHVCDLVPCWFIVGGLVPWTEVFERPGRC